MASSSPRFRHVSLKIDRARLHVANLEGAVREFFATNPYRVSTRHDADSRKLIYYIAEVLPTPEQLSLVLGDAIQNLATALDHLAYQLVCNDTSDAPPNPKGLYFPIADSQAKYEATKQAKLLGARPETLARIDAIMPYRGGNDPLWQLSRLNNIEKHRLLLTVGSQAAGIHLGQLMSGLFSKSMPTGVVALIEGMNVYVNPADKGFPLQPGFRLYVGQEDEPPNPKQQFRFELVLNEPGVAEGAPLLDTVAKLLAAVDCVATELAPLLE